jgi:hypothetical protein
MSLLQCPTVLLSIGNCTLDVNSSLGFNCSCPHTFYGAQCENRMDLCLNIDCMNRGYCIKTLGECKCFKGYSGKNNLKEKLTVKLLFLYYLLKVSHVRLSLLN